MEYVVHTFNINNKAFRSVYVHTMEKGEEIIDCYSGHLWWRKTWTEKTGRCFIRIVHSQSPISTKKIDTIYFDRKEDADFWYSNTYDRVFLNKTTTNSKPPAPPKDNKPKGKNGLRLV